MPTMGKVKFGLHFRGWQFQHGKQYAPVWACCSSSPVMVSRHLLAFCLSMSGLPFALLAVSSSLRPVSQLHRYSA